MSISEKDFAEIIGLNINEIIEHFINNPYQITDRIIGIVSRYGYYIQKDELRSCLCRLLKDTIFTNAVHKAENNSASIVESDKEAIKKAAAECRAAVCEAKANMLHMKNYLKEAERDFEQIKQCAAQCSSIVKEMNILSQKIKLRSNTLEDVSNEIQSKKSILNEHFEQAKSYCLDTEHFAEQAKVYCCLAKKSAEHLDAACYKIADIEQIDPVLIEADRDEDVMSVFFESEADIKGGLIEEADSCALLDTDKADKAVWIDPWTETLRDLLETDEADEAEVEETEDDEIEDNKAEQTDSCRADEAVCSDAEDDEIEETDSCALLETDEADEAEVEETEDDEIEDNKAEQTDSCRIDEAFCSDAEDDLIEEAENCSEELSVPEKEEQELTAEDRVRDYFLREFKDRSLYCRTMQYRRFKNGFENSENCSLPFEEEELYQFLVKSGAGHLKKAEKEGDDDCIEACVGVYEDAAEFICDKINELLKHENLSCVYASCFWERYKDNISSFGIHSADFMTEKLKSCESYFIEHGIAICEVYEENGVCVFCLEENADDNFNGLEDLVRFMASKHDAVSVDEIKSAVWNIPSYILDNTIIKESNFNRKLKQTLINVGGKRYAYADCFMLDEDILDRLFSLIDEALADAPFISCASLARKAEECGISELREWADRFNKIGLNSLCRLNFKDSFDVKSGGIICSKGDNIGLREIMKASVQDCDSVTIDELEDITSELNTEKHEKKGIRFDGVYDALIRISRDEFKADKYFDFDIEAIDSLLEENLEGRSFIAFSQADELFDKLPSCNSLGLAWNRYIFESYLHRFSISFGIVHLAGFNKGFACGAAVLKDSAIYEQKTSYQFLYLAAESLKCFKDEWLNRDDEDGCARQLINSLGLIKALRYKEMDKAVTLAKQMLDGKVLSNYEPYEADAEDEEYYENDDSEELQSKAIIPEAENHIYISPVDDVSLHNRIF